MAPGAQNVFTAAVSTSSRSALSQRTLGIILAVGSLVGVIASAELMFATLARAAGTKAEDLSCSASPFISCGQTMVTWQGHLLGVPNPFTGLVAFAAMLAVGVFYASGTRIPEWIRWGQLIGMGVGFAMVTLFQYTIFFVLDALCPWCMVIWSMTGPMFFASLANRFGWRPRTAVLLTVLWYAAIIGMIAWKFGMRFLIWWGWV